MTARWTVQSIWHAAVALIVLGSPSVHGDEPGPCFASEVAPILVRNCLPCHRDGKAEGGLSVATPAALQAGGQTFGRDILVPGDPEASALIACLQPDAEPRMPYKLPVLPDSAITTLSRWVKAGALFDGASGPDMRITALVDPLSHLPAVAVRSPSPEPSRTITFVPDGSRVVAAQGTSVVLLDAHDGREIRRWEDFPGPVTDVRVAPDGRAVFVASGWPGQNGVLTRVSVDDDGPRRDARAHRDAILALALAPDGTRMATASYDRTIAVWDPDTMSVVHTLREHNDAVHGLAFSPDGTQLASASGDRTIKVWDVATGQRRLTLGEATAEQYAVRFSPDGRHVLGAGVDRTIRTWRLDGPNAELVRQAIAHEGPILKLAVSPDGKTLVSCSEDRTIRVWNLATMAPLRTLAKVPDWPLDVAVSPDGTHLAVARFDGVSAMLDLASGALLWPKPALVRPVSLAPPSPRGGERGKVVRVTLSGRGIGQASAVVFPEGQLTASIIGGTDARPDPNQLVVDVDIAPDASPGSHRFLVRTPLGVSPSQTFVVSEFPETPMNEADSEPVPPPVIALPTTLVGVIDRPGDLDHARFAARHGESVVFEARSAGLGSVLSPTLTVRDDSGRILAESSDPGAGRDPSLVFSLPADGAYTLTIGDATLGGSTNHLYRVTAGVLPRLNAVWPRGVSAGRRTTVTARGVQLGDNTTITLEPPASMISGTLLTATLPDSNSGPVLNPQRMVVAEGDQGIEQEPNDSVLQANPLPFPGGLSGRLDRPGDVDYLRFEARRGEPVIVEAFASRLGVDLDLAIDILDAAGQPVPRVVLRPVAETNVAFRDHTASGRNIRLTTWNDLAVGDFVLIGREALRLAELPRNADDDAIFWGLGHARFAPGERIAAFETTPEHHPMGQPIWKVEVHPPGASLPPGGAAPVVLSYRNDDGGSEFARDPRVTFDPPADGTYLARVEEVRGWGGREEGYHVVLRRPRPDFTIRLSTDELNIPRGGTTLVTAHIQRRDGFEGPVTVTLDGLPRGVQAAPTTIESGLHAADLVVSATTVAQSSSEPLWRARAKGRWRDGDTDRTITHDLDPGGPGAGWVTIGPAPNLVIRADRDAIRLRPGERTELTFTVERSPAFQGRVPIDVRNLPTGVKVLDIGLNGVLISESQTSRKVVIQAEPWAPSIDRPFYAVGRCEAAGTEHSSAPIGLEVAADGAVATGGP